LQQKFESKGQFFGPFCGKNKDGACGLLGDKKARHFSVSFFESGVGMPTPLFSYEFLEQSWLKWQPLLPCVLRQKQKQRAFHLIHMKSKML